MGLCMARDLLVRSKPENIPCSRVTCAMHAQEQVDGHVRDWDPEIKSFLVRSKQPGTGCHQLTSKQPLQQRPSDSDASNYFFRSQLGSYRYMNGTGLSSMQERRRRHTPARDQPQL